MDPSVVFINSTGLKAEQDDEFCGMSINWSDFISLYNASNGSVGFLVARSDDTASGLLLTPEKKILSLILKKKAERERAERHA